MNNKQQIEKALLANKGSFSRRSWQVLADLGWHVNGFSSDYIDIHFEYYYEETVSDAANSVDIIFTTSRETGQFYLSFGCNHGDGFNLCASIPFNDIGDELSKELDVALRLDKSGKIAEAFTAYPAAKTVVEQSLAALQAFLLDPKRNPA